jgi:hypothetical protein
MTRLEDIDAELEALRDWLDEAEDVCVDCGANIRTKITALIHERDKIPRQRC